MKEKISALIAFCNRSILAWYRREFPRDIGEFTPVDIHDEGIINTIYDMYLIVKYESRTKIQMLVPVVKYYFAIAVVEYYVLQCGCPLFSGVIIKQMVDFSMSATLSKYRRRMMGFNTSPFKTLKLKNPYKIDIPTKKML
jgi:hypothetical protein